MGNHQRVCITKLLKSLYPSAQGDDEGDHHPASILREEDAEEAEGYFEHLLRGQGEAMTDGEDYFDRIVGEIEDLIIDERFLQLQSGRGNVLQTQIKDDIQEKVIHQLFWFMFEYFLD